MLFLLSSSSSVGFTPGFCSTIPWLPVCCKYNSGRLAVGKYTELLATRARNELLKYYRMYLEYSTKVPKYIKVS